MYYTGLVEQDKIVADSVHILCDQKHETTNLSDFLNIQIHFRGKYLYKCYL